MINKVILIIIITCCGTVSYSQTKNNEIGLQMNTRIGRPQVGLNYIRTLKEHHQLDLSYYVGVRARPVWDIYNYGFSAYYRYKRNLIGGLYWHVGAGMSVENVQLPSMPNKWYFGLGAQAGLGYDFSQHNVPIVFDMAVKPTARFNSGRSYLSIDAQAALRFKF